MYRSIFDLDGTVIDSTHRHATLPDGSLDLAHWIENSTPEKIAGDSLLPLADYMRMFFPHHEVLVCTARVMGEADYEFLFDNGLQADAILSRPEGNCLPDGYLKEMLLRDHATRRGFTWVEFVKNTTIFDDNASVLDTLGRVGIRTICARTLNRVLAEN
jgi:hypothetical protein